jgi:NADH dehydrogenase FAD-containing subunit|tara:strand:+ start:305 stop:460 length:156 start_codon:yes stop_codon:yes gene_type:complete
MGGGNSKQVTVKGGKKKVVIVGGSFGGKSVTQCLVALDKKEEQFEILIIDK